MAPAVILAGTRGLSQVQGQHWLHIKFQNSLGYRVRHYLKGKKKSKIKITTTRGGVNYRNFQQCGCFHLNAHWKVIGTRMFMMFHVRPQGTSELAKNLKVSNSGTKHRRKGEEEKWGERLKTLKFLSLELNLKMY